MTRFAHAVREELWSRGRRIESRLSHGEAIEEHDGSITATDARDDVLLSRAGLLLEQLRDAMPQEDALIRLVAEAGTDGDQATMTIRLGAVSIVTAPGHVRYDLGVLHASIAANRTGGSFSKERPILWRNGSASVLLHEAAGHPLEHGHDPLPLPSWLQLDIALELRRSSFRDIPIQRMTNVVAAASGAPFDVPADPIEVYLVDGGSFDPLTDTVTVRVAASSIGAFRVVEPRTGLRFLGAAGKTERYPGVICSREGQEVVVGSHAPTLLTVWR